MTAERYMGLVAGIGCTLCRRLGQAPLSGTEVHHRRSGTGGGKRASDFDTMALCFHHHREHPGSFHVLGTKGFVAFYGITEDDLIADTILLLGFTAAQVETWKHAEKSRRRKRAAKVNLGIKEVKPAQQAPQAKPEKPKRTIPSRPKSAVAMPQTCQEAFDRPVPQLKTAKAAPVGPKAKIPSRPMTSSTKVKSSQVDQGKAKIASRPFSSGKQKAAWPSRKLNSRNTLSAATRG